MVLSHKRINYETFLTLHIWLEIVLSGKTFFNVLTGKRTQIVDKQTSVVLFVYF